MAPRPELWLVLGVERRRFVAVAVFRADAAVAAVNHQAHAALSGLADAGTRRIRLREITAFGGDEGADGPSAAGDAAAHVHLARPSATHDAFSSATNGSAAGTRSGSARGADATTGLGTGVGTGAFAGTSRCPSIRRAAVHAANVVGSC